MTADVADIRGQRSIRGDGIQITRLDHGFQPPMGTDRILPIRGIPAIRGKAEWSLWVVIDRWSGYLEMRAVPPTLRWVR